MKTLQLLIGLALVAASAAVWREVLKPGGDPRGTQPTWWQYLVLFAVLVLMPAVGISLMLNL